MAIWNARIVEWHSFSGTFRMPLKRRSPSGEKANRTVTTDATPPISNASLYRCTISAACTAWMSAIGLRLLVGALITTSTGVVWENGAPASISGVAMCVTMTRGTGVRACWSSYSRLSGIEFMEMETQAPSRGSSSALFFTLELFETVL